MVQKIKWTRRALKDLSDIYEFIARNSGLYARIQVERLQDAVANLNNFPSMGRTVPEFQNLPYREILVGDYRVIYRHDEKRKQVNVMAVVHGRRLLKGIRPVE